MILRCRELDCEKRPTVKKRGRNRRQKGKIEDPRGSTLDAPRGLSNTSDKHPP